MEYFLLKLKWVTPLGLMCVFQSAMANDYYHSPYRTLGTRLKYENFDQCVATLKRARELPGIYLRAFPLGPIASIDSHCRDYQEGFERWQKNYQKRPRENASCSPNIVTLECGLHDAPVTESDPPPYEPPLRLVIALEGLDDCRNKLTQVREIESLTLFAKKAENENLDLICQHLLARPY